ncbi:hypothetical protein [Nostoc sp.]|uniref:hypothetical protein n=1 Tax=Nostoc sp. TaxID=1180 RepID=UPI002FF8B0D7
MPSLVPRIPTDTVTGSPFYLLTLELDSRGHALYASVSAGLACEIWNGLNKPLQMLWDTTNRVRTAW